MSEPIRIIKCPRLNARVSGEAHTKEIAVKFDRREPHEPEAIMCDMYDPERGKCKIKNKDDYQQCTFSEWVEFKK